MNGLEKNLQFRFISWDNLSTYSFSNKVLHSNLLTFGSFIENLEEMLLLKSFVF